MSASMNQTARAQGTPPLSNEHAQHSTCKKSTWFTLLFWALVALLLVGAVIMRLYHLDVPFDRDGYDEGVYWQSLRAMLAGQSLYQPIFYSQPPVFLLSTFPGFALFGGSLWSARAGIALVSLLGLLGAYLLGKSLAGRLGALAALLFLVVNPFYLAQSQTIQAEVSSVAFTLLAIGFAFLWWRQPDGWRGICWGVLSGLTLVLSIFCKLLCVSTVVPIAILVLARIWQIWHKEPGTNSRSWLPILAGVGIALLTTVAVVLPFLGSFQGFWSGTVTFHEVAANVMEGSMVGNYHVMKPLLFSLLGVAAFYGMLTALLRRDWRVFPLLAWLLTTFYLLLNQYPLFYHHLIILEPPFIALAVLGLAEPSFYKEQLAKLNLEIFAPFITGLAILLALITSVSNFQQDIHYYKSADTNSVSTATQKELRVAADLRQAITPEQWVVTDGQFIAGLANRDTPPSLVDTSAVRIDTGYITLAQLEQVASDPRVHAVLFYTGRFYLANVADFHTWVARHFHLLQTYSPGQELWGR